MENPGRPGRSRLGGTLAQLLESTPTTASDAIDKACRSVGDALGADQAEVLLYDRASDSLLVAGASNMLLARKQQALGLHRLPPAHGDRAVAALQTGMVHRIGRAEEDPGGLACLTAGLGVQSVMSTSLRLGEAQRGVLVAMSMREELFNEEHCDFLRAAALWLGLVARQVAVLEQPAAVRRPRAKRQRQERLARRRVRDLEAGVEAVHASVAQVSQAFMKAQLDLTAMQGEVALLHGAIGALEDELVQRSPVSERERCRREQLEGELGSVEEKLRRAEDRIATLEAQLNG